MIAPVHAALATLLNAPARASPLAILARVKYPERELRPRPRPDGSLVFTLYMWGWEYKHRGPHPPAPPPADTAAMQAVFDTALTPWICTTIDRGNFIELVLEKIR